jgi:hypothetical protein
MKKLKDNYFTDSAHHHIYYICVWNKVENGIRNKIYDGVKREVFNRITDIYFNVYVVINRNILST